MVTFERVRAHRKELFEPEVEKHAEESDSVREALRTAASAALAFGANNA